MELAPPAKTSSDGENELFSDYDTILRNQFESFVFLASMVHRMHVYGHCSNQSIHRIIPAHATPTVMMSFRIPRI